MFKSFVSLRAMMLAIGLICAGLVPLHSFVSAAPPSVNWVAASNLSNSASKSVYPAVAYDADNKLHVAWLEYDADEVQTSRLFYTNNVDGSFRAPVMVDANAGKNNSQILAIAVQQSRVHLLYTTEDKSMRHTLLSLNGSVPSGGPSTRMSPAGARGYAPNLAVDSAGRVHAAWIDNRSGQYQVYHRVWADGNWEGGDRAVQETGKYQNFPSLAPTSDGRMHIVYENNNSLAYGAFDGRWQELNRPGPGAPNQQAMTSDGTTLYVVWSVSANTHQVFFTKGINGNWSAPKLISDAAGWGDFPSIFYSPNNSNVYAVWAASSNGSNNRVAVREINARGDMSDTAIIGGAPSIWPRGAGSRAPMAVVWQDKTGGNEEVKLAIGTPGPPPAPTPTPVPAPATGSFDFAHDAFRSLWIRTDSLVQQGAVNYSWIWGPSAFTQGVREYYVQSPGQSRLVQYFDKSRMEINQPDAARGPYYVTNGRLADELITGQLQAGDAQYEQRPAARISVAGDPQNEFPQYRDLQAVYRKQRPGDRANELLVRGGDGSIRTELLPNANNDPSTVIAQRVANLGIPKVFWDYMNRPGTVVEGGNRVTATPLYDWRYVIGEPLTEAYWVYIKVGGVDRGVLVQAFERRVLTFTPSNAPAFQVEMGNIGRHYFEWRYGVRP